MDSDYPSLDDGALAVSRCWNPARGQVGLRGVGLGRLLGLGSSRECVAHALVGRDGLSPFGHHAGAQGNDEGLEHGPDSLNVLALYLRNISHTERHRFFSPLVCPITHRTFLLQFPVFDDLALSLFAFDSTRRAQK